MSDAIKGFRGKDGPILLDFSGLANVPGAIQSIGALTARPGDHFEVATVDDTGKIITVKAVEKPGGGAGQNPDEIRAAVFEYLEQDATGAVVAVDAQEPTAEDNTTYIVMQSKTGTIFRLGIGDNGLPFVTDEAGATVWSGDSSGGDDSGGAGGDDSGDSGSAEIPSDVVGDYRNTAITEIPDNAFENNSKITGIDAPNATKVGLSAFGHCGSLGKVSLPKVKTLSQYAFVWCTALTKVALPRATAVGTQSFGFCQSLAIADLGGVPGAAGGLGNGAFTGDSALSALILRCDSTVWPSHNAALSGTAIANGSGHIYVPAKILDRYKATSPWSTYAERFRVLEDYTVDGTSTGALDETKIGGDAA